MIVMAVNKVKLSNGETLIDISGDSVTPETLAKGVTAHDKSGAKITGTMVSRTKIYEITLAHVGGWVLLTTLDEEVLAHINDPNIVVSFMRLGDYLHTNQTVSLALATNRKMGVYSTSYAYYGLSCRANTATSTSFNGIFYPANDSGASTSLGGTQFKLNGNKYYIRPYDVGINPGTYRLTFTW